MIPQHIGRYEIKSEIGRGGMATVYLAEDPRFSRTVAIKVLPREFLHDPEFRARFEREAKTIASLEHSAIVPVYDYGEDDGQLYLVMRYMPGGSLADRLTQGPISPTEATTIIQRISAALERAHQQGIVHRDLKPGNILLDQYGDPFLSDFGIAHLASSQTSLTASGHMVGTPTYMSPEQVYGDKTLDNRSDIYALGVILFQMLTGRVPYEADSPAKVMMQHVMEPVPNILDITPTLPAACEPVVSKALAKNRDDRYSTATDLSKAFTAATQSYPIPDNLPTMGAGLPHVTQPTATPPTPANAPTVTPSLETVPATAVPAYPTPPPGTPGTGSVPAIEGNGRSVPIWVWGLVAFLALCCFAGFGSIVLLGYIGTTTRHATETSIAETSAAVAVITKESPATEIATETPVLEATKTKPTLAPPATNTATPAPTKKPPTAVPPTATSEAGYSLSPETSVDPLFAQDGRLTHEPADNVAESAIADTALRDFMTQVTVDNPYSTNDGVWDIGFTFRQSSPNQEYRLVVRSDGTWSLNNRQGEQDDFVNSGLVRNVLNTADDGKNRYTLMVYDTWGYFFLNDHFVSKLDLSERVDFGDLALTTGFYPGSEQEGAITEYRDWGVWPLDPIAGPYKGQLTHYDTGKIENDNANINVLNFIAEATFVNPYSPDKGKWDIGFNFRETDINTQFRVVLFSESYWGIGDFTDGEQLPLGTGDLENFNVQDNGRNKVTLIVLNKRGYLFLNDLFITELDLKSRLTSGDVAVGTAYIFGDEIAGEATGYEGFTIWQLPNP